MEARTLVVVASLVCREWHLLALRILHAQASLLVAPETLYRHLKVHVMEKELFARLVWARRLSSREKDEALVELCLALAATGDSRVLSFRIGMCANTFEGNPRRSHKRFYVRRVVSPWFSLMSLSEKSVLGSSPPEMCVYFRLVCASGLVVADQSESSFFDSRRFSLDCNTLFKECNVESADAFRKLVQACLVPLLKDIVLQS